DVTQGIAIEMIVDRSSSMSIPMNFRHRSQDRLETVKAVFQEFVFGDRSSGLKGRHSDLLGVIAFAHYPYTFCPLTLDHNALKFALDRIELIPQYSQSDEDGTAIGDAVAMGVARLQDAERTLAAQTQKDASAYRLKSKVIILLTDGQDRGLYSRSISEAAELAKKYGIKVYTIAIVTDEERLMSYDTTDIENLAKTTGGTFHTCDSADALLGIYREIDELERSEVESIRYVTHRELYFPFLAWGIATLLLAILSRMTIFRRLP
ncbi:MAG: VWA domain-containing protein, partial [Victivallales bacterium]|nr:VWA domain-containing protein [Victivallales bacterium]